MNIVFNRRTFVVHVSFVLMITAAVANTGSLPTTLIPKCHRMLYTCNWCTLNLR